MAVTAYMQAFEVKSVGTGVGGRRCDDTFGEEGQSLGGLEGGAWRIEAHDTAVEQGFSYILTQQLVVFTALAPYHHPWVV